MNNKLILIALSFIFILSSCKNIDESGDNNSQTETNSENYQSESETDSIGKEKDQTNNTTPTTINTNKKDAPISDNASKGVEGQYLKIGEEADINCGCYCLDVNFISNSVLCLSPDKIYIDVKYKKTSTNLINVFLVGPSDINSEGKEIPWDKFDRDIPIATLTPKSDGELDLDWLGFSINGDLAMDYAIFGKKTLEGKFKRK